MPKPAFILSAVLAFFTLAGPATYALDESTKTKVRSEVEQASKAWIAAFNRGDAKACAAAYTADAVMTARPVADVVGREAILEFWVDVLAGDPGTLRYEDPQIHVLDAQTAVLSSRWSMSNLGSGVITLELWERQQDGSWLLVEDRFEIRQKNGE